jgi:anti-sigma B factor antagonist
MERRSSAANPLVIPEIVTLPVEIDLTNAGSVAGDLCSACRRGANVVIADMTQTVFCDSSGLRGLLLAYDEAAAASAELRLACSSAAVLRILQLTGLDGMLRIFPDLDAALTPAPTRP